MVALFLSVCLVLIFGPIVMFFIVRWYNRRLLKKQNRLSRIWAICPECGELIYPHHLYCECGQEQTVNPDLLDDQVNVPEINPCSACGRGLRIYEGGWTLYNRQATCPRSQCRANIGRCAGMFQEILIPLLGATGAGKSAYLSALASQLEGKFGNRLAFPFPNTTAEYMRRFADGQPPRPTDVTTKQPPSFTVDIHAANKKRKTPIMRLFFYDPAGEVYNVGDNYAFLHCLDLMDGAIILIDPLSIPKIRDKCTEQLEQTHSENFRIGGDTRDIVQYLKEEIYQRTYRDYEYEKRHSESNTHFYLDDRKKEYHYARCAVVITKCDLPGLDGLFGEAAIQQEIRNHPSLSYEDAMNAVCVRRLQETWGSELQFLDELFADVRCFSVSSFGCMPATGSQFTPRRVELPLLWLLQPQYAKILGTIK